MKRTKTLWKSYKFQGWGREKLDESGIVSESKNDDETPKDIENVFKGKKKKKQRTQNPA